MMNKFAFDWKSSHNKEPRVIDDETIAKHDTIKYFILAIVISVSIIYFGEILTPNKKIVADEQIQDTYTICQDKEAIKYYDKALDKVLIRE